MVFTFNSETNTKCIVFIIITTFRLCYHKSHSRTNYHILNRKMTCGKYMRIGNQHFAVGISFICVAKYIKCSFSHQVSLSCVLSIGSLIIYLIDASE